jgi:acyl-CoA thioester hydrolase
MVSMNADTTKPEASSPLSFSTREYSHEFVVRDYECDMGQVVNNSVYLNYLEHARHELLKTVGVSFGEMARRGISLVVTRIEADFKSSLVSGDRFVVRTSMARKGRLRLQFNQRISRLTDDQLMLNALVTATALNELGRPEIHPDLERAFNSLNFVNT